MNKTEVLKPNPLAKGFSIEDLEAIEPHCIFAQGEILNKDLPTPMVEVYDDIDLILKWVAVKGGVNDWAIYLQKSKYSWEDIKSNGDKTYSENNIVFLVPCTPEVLKKYRY